MLQADAALVTTCSPRDVAHRRDFSALLLRHRRPDWRKHVRFDEALPAPGRGRFARGRRVKAERELGWKATVLAPELAAS
jgi:GDPmannose 4,6-dehydratase